MTNTFKLSNMYDRSRSYRYQNQKAFRTHFKVIVSQSNNGLKDMDLSRKERSGNRNTIILLVNNYDATLPQDFLIISKDVSGNNKIMNEVKKVL